jgi:inhibitor of cysteine peptidase
VTGVKRYADPEAAIQVAVGEQFAVELAGNPSTGYTWQVRVDGRLLELLGQEFEPSGDGVGAGGVEVFRLRALAAGETEIACAYQRPWDTESRDTRRFRVAVSE